MSHVLVTIAALAAPELHFPGSPFPQRASSAATAKSGDIDRCNEWSFNCGACLGRATSGSPNTHGGDSDSCVWCESELNCVSPGAASPATCGPAQCIRSPLNGDDAHCDTTAGWPGVSCPAFVPPPPPPPISPLIWDDAECSCADYCDYKCSNAVEGYGTKPENVSLYRLTPYNAPGIDSMNTADPGGDVAFILERKTIQVECAQNPKGERCFLAHANLYGHFTVEVDGKWGPYQFCNPVNTPSGPNVSHFECCNSFDHDLPGTCLPKGQAANISSFTPYPRDCQCDRGNHSVGKLDHGAMEKWSGWAHNDPWTTVLGGFWFSTPRDGKCKHGERLGTGKKGECTWRTLDEVYKNTSCVDAQLDKAVEAHGKTCFATCPPKSNKAFYDCYIGCYFSAVGGNPKAPGGKLSPMSKAELTTPWTNAISSEDPAKGGCPRCHGSPPYHLGSCPWKAA